MKHFQWVLLVVGGLWMACSSETKPTKEDNSHKTVFRYNQSSGISSLDPAFARDQANMWGVIQIFNGLVQPDADLSVVPCIAKSWEMDAAGKVYVFRLRDDVYFHDHEVFEGGKGRKVVASDFVYSFDRIVDDKLASPGLWVFSHIKRDESGKCIGFHAPDDTTFVIELEKAHPPFLGLLSMPYCSVVPREVVEHYGEDFSRHPVGTGPFIFKMWSEGENLIYHKNPRYFENDEHGRPLPYLDAISVSFIKDKQSAFMEFVKGGFDFVSGIDASYKDELLTLDGRLRDKFKKRFYMVTGPYLNTEYLGILMDTSLQVVKDSPLRYKKVRKAINMGFDREKLIKYLRNNIGTPADAGFVPKGMPAYDPEKIKGYTFDPEGAAALLAEAGFPGGKGLGIIKLSTNPAYLDLCEAIQSKLTELGLEVELDVNPPATHREMVARSQLTFFRGSWIADYFDEENYLGLFYTKNFTPGGPNYTHFSNARFDELYEQAQQEMDPVKRKELFQQMDAIIVEEAPVVVMYYDQVVRVVNKRVEGLGINPINLLVLKKVRINLDE
ncbi:MAG: ABC transporter substrate-binding protein [Flavobacteriales bacterium]|nr:ABC transporter substrate-binding protein [Flavobacteriales bacterium]